MQKKLLNPKNDYVFKRIFGYKENASITNSGTTATVQDYTFTGKYYNLDISQEQLANKSFTGIIYVSKKECTSKDIIPFYIIFSLRYLLGSYVLYCKYI